MNPKEMPHAVTRAMQIAHAVLPEELTCKGVQLGTAGIIGENCLCQSDMTFHHQCEVEFLFGRGSAEGNGACDVGGSVEVLRATVNQQKPVRFKG